MMIAVRFPKQERLQVSTSIGAATRYQGAFVALPRSPATALAFTPAPCRACSVKEKPIEINIQESANKLRCSVELAKYKRAVLGLVFLKFASDKLVNV